MAQSLLIFLTQKDKFKNWQASETLSGVTQLKIGDVCLLICVCGRTYVIVL